jgi:hypothetical protein
MTHRDSFLASPCVPSPVSAIRTLKLPLLPLWEKGVGGMRGKGARECKTSLISPKNSTLESRGMKGQRVLRITLPITLEPAWHQSRTIPAITENHAPRGCAGVPNREPGTRNREPRAPWVRGRPEPRTRNQEPRTTRPVGARASRTENQEPGTENHMPPGCAGVPNREPGTKNREPHAPWVRGRPRPHTRNPERPWVRGRPARMCATPARARSAGVPARIRAILSVPGARASPPAYAQS